MEASSLGWRSIWLTGRPWSEEGKAVGWMDLSLHGCGKEGATFGLHICGGWGSDEPPLGRSPNKMEKVTIRRSDSTNGHRWAGWAPSWWNCGWSSVPPSCHLPTLPVLQLQTPLLDTQLQKPPIHSAMSSPKPLLWAILGWWPALGQRAPFESPWLLSLCV